MFISCTFVLLYRVTCYVKETGAAVLIGLKVEKVYCGYFNLQK